MTTKKCPKCNETKSIEAFGKHKNRKDGLRFECKECRKIHYGESVSQNAARCARWYVKNKEHASATSAQWQKDNKEHHNANQRKWKVEKKKTDPVWVLMGNVRTMVGHMFRSTNGSKQGQSILKHLPYSFVQLKEHLESQFTEGMSWENRSEWHIDHIIPQSKFKFDSLTHPNFLKCWDLSNLQPLWAVDNMRKGNIFPLPQK